jgi:hypothetical protein
VTRRRFGKTSYQDQDLGKPLSVTDRFFSQVLHSCRETWVRRLISPVEYKFSAGCRTGISLGAGRGIMYGKIRSAMSRNPASLISHTATFALAASPCAKVVAIRDGAPALLAGMRQRIAREVNPPEARYSMRALREGHRCSRRRLRSLRPTRCGRSGALSGKSHRSRHAANRPRLLGEALTLSSISARSRLTRLPRHARRLQQVVDREIPCT